MHTGKANLKTARRHSTKATLRTEMSHREPRFERATTHETCPLCGDRVFEALPRFRRTELVKCAGCEGIFAPTIPTHDELVRHYGGYPRGEKLNSPVSIARREELLDRFERYRSHNRILDVGCDIGLILDQARARGWQTFGTEFMQEAVDICQRHGHTMHLGPLEDAALEPGTFDVVVYTEVIEHITSQRSEFPLVHELLRPGGLLYVTTPNFDSVSRRLLADRWEVIEYPEHLVYFTPRTLRDFMIRCGFDVEWIEVTGVSVSRLLASLNRSADDADADADDAARPGRARTRDIRADELIRRAMEHGPFSQIKLALNAILHTASLGDSIKAGFRKPSR